MTALSYIFLAGASRGVGREIAKCLIPNYRVKALLRTEATRAELEALGVEVVLADALNYAEVEAAIITYEPPLAVISSIGGVPQAGDRADYRGNKNLIDAALKAGAQRFILVSSIGAGDSKVALPPQALETLGAVLAEKEQAEQNLIASGLTYTVIRPGGLKSDHATGNGVLTTNASIAGSINRADVAQLVCACLASANANNQVLSAVDKNMLFGQPEFEEFSLS